MTDLPDNIEEIISRLAQKEHVHEFERQMVRDAIDQLDHLSELLFLRYFYVAARHLLGLEACQDIEAGYEDRIPGGYRYVGR